MVAVAYHRAYGVPVVSTRCANLFGPGDTNWRRLVPGTFRSVLRGERPVLRSDGTLRRDYLYVDDAVSGYLALAVAGKHDRSLLGSAFNFSGGQNLSVAEMVEAIAGVAGRPDLRPVTTGNPAGEIAHQALDDTRARQRLGWCPGWSLDTALAQTHVWYATALTPYTSGVR